MGYMRAASIASLLGGSAAGAAFLISGYTIEQGNDFIGHATGAAAGGVLSAGMGSRYLKTGKFMPTGLVAAVGIISTLYNAKKASDWS